MARIIENCIESILKKNDGSITIKSRKIEYEKEAYEDDFGNIGTRLINVVFIESKEYQYSNLTEEQLAVKISEIEAEQ